jgi:hypothetical protein
MLRNRRLPAAREPITSDNLVTRPWYRFFDEFFDLAVGSFYSTADQTAVADTPAAITYNVTSFSRYVSASGSQVSVSNGGLYNIQFSIQFENPDATEDNVVVWLRVNGADVPDTASWVTVPKKHGSLNGKVILALNLFYEFAPRDVFQLFWLTEDARSAIGTVPAGANYPQSPGVILTVNQVI